MDLTPDPCCRRSFLRWSLAGYLGLCLSPRLARADRSRSGRLPGRGQAEHVIVLYMAGGMSQTDTFDPKPGSASAGPLSAIRTSAEGVQFSELLPRLAEQARHMAVVRGMATKEGAHERARYLLHTGYAPSGTVAHPDIGALTSRHLPNDDLDLPAYVAINGSGIGQGFLDVEHAPFVVNDPTRPVENLTYPEGVSPERFERRRKLLEAIERRFRKEHEGAETEGHTKVYTKADRMMHSPQTAAFDLSDEAGALRDAYGRDRFGQGCLMARRLVETGVRVVEVQLGGWDTHQDNFTRNEQLAGTLDAGFATLIGDLRERDLLEKTLVLCMTEFGRTPHINDDDGRDHWANGWSLALAGGGVQGGRAVGATNADGSRVAERPVLAQEVLASVVHALGVDREHVDYTAQGRPIQVVDAGHEPIRELFAE